MLKDKKNEVWNIVEIARNKERPNVRFYIENIFDDFIEFHGDRNFRDDKAVIGGIASIDKISVTTVKSCITLFWLLFIIALNASMILLNISP